MRVAAFDCGTNSLRLLIADVENGRARDVHRVMRIVRLGQGVDATGEIHPDAMRRAFDVTREYARLCDEAQVAAVRFVATSASRDARNAGEFVTGIESILGTAPEVISGREEAWLSFTGACAGLGVAGSACVVDLGGGSTEVVLGAADSGSADDLRAHSMDVGCVRMTERHLHSDPPTAAEIAAATADVDAALDAAQRDVPLARAGTLIGVAGTVTTLTAHALGLPRYDSEAIHGQVLSVERTLAVCDDLLRMTHAERARLGFMHPGRVDVIGAGALVWSLVVRRVANAAGLTTVTTSEHDILDGIALALAAGSENSAVSPEAPA